MMIRGQLTCLLLTLASASAALAQSGGVYSLRWNTLGGGGGTFATGGLYRLGSSAGQPDAGRLTGGIYALHGGFWVPTVQTSVAAPTVELTPLAFATRLPQPNPFQSTTTLAFDLPAARTVRLVVHSIDGRVVRRLAEGAYEAGRHRAIWDGRDDRGNPVASGVYFARLVAGEFKSTQRIVRLD